MLSIGLSLKTQFLYCLVFLTRYCDLFFSYVSLYNTCMKLFFIASSMGVVYLMRFKHPVCQTYDKLKDNFDLKYILIPCAVLALLINEYFTVFEVQTQ